MMPGSGPRPVSVIIPAHNEADRISDTVRAVSALADVSEVVVVDDGSSDDTAAIAGRSGASRVLRLPRNMGKGAALNAGLKACSSPVLLMLDADLGATAVLAQALLDPVLHDECDMTVAVFPELLPASSSVCQIPSPATRTPNPESHPPSGGFGIALRLARAGIRRLTGVHLAAPLSGQRALRREIVESMGGFASGFAVETALSGWAAAGGWRVCEVPLAMSHRRTGRDVRGWMHRLRQLVHIGWALMWLAVRRGRAARARAGIR